MKSKSNKHKLEKRKKMEMSEGERNLAVRGRKATEREVVARDAAERERESHTCALRGRESWCGLRNFNSFFFRNLLKSIFFNFF